MNFEMAWLYVITLLARFSQLILLSTAQKGASYMFSIMHEESWISHYWNLQSSNKLFLNKLVLKVWTRKKELIGLPESFWSHKNKLFLIFVFSIPKAFPSKILLLECCYIRASFPHSLPLAMQYLIQMLIYTSTGQQLCTIENAIEQKDGLA